MLYERFDSWENGPVAEFLSFSSFSLSLFETWAWEDPRPYGIVFLPGYAPPSQLDRESKDALWVDRPIEKPKLVWDGFSKEALFEVIRECMDPAGESRRIVVIDMKARKLVRDDRDPKLLSLRPKRKDFRSPGALSNHVCELFFWSELVGGETKNIYADMFEPSVPSMFSQDGRARERLFCDKALSEDQMNLARRNAQKALSGGSLRRGSGAGMFPPEQDPVRRFDTSINQLFGRLPVTRDDIPRLEEFDGSFYRLSIAKGKERQRARRARSLELERRRREMDQ